MLRRSQPHFVPGDIAVIDTPYANPGGGSCILMTSCRPSYSFFLAECLRTHEACAGDCHRLHGAPPW